MQCAAAKIIFENNRWKQKIPLVFVICRSSIFFPINPNRQQAFLSNWTGKYRLFKLYILTLSNIVLTRKKICFRNSLRTYYLQGKFATCFETMFIDLHLRASMLRSDIVLSILVYPVYSMDFYSVIAWQQCNLYNRTGTMYFPYQKAVNLFRLYVLYQYTNYAARYATKRADAILCSVAPRRAASRRVNARSVSHCFSRRANERESCAVTSSAAIRIAQ